MDYINSNCDDSNSTPSLIIDEYRSSYDSPRVITSSTDISDNNSLQYSNTSMKHDRFGAAQQQQPPHLSPAAQQADNIQVCNPVPRSFDNSYEAFYTNGPDKIDTLTYRELQQIAKRFRYPGNMKTAVLKQLLRARYEGDELQIQNILRQHMSRYKRGRRSNSEERPKRRHRTNADPQWLPPNERGALSTYSSEESVYYGVATSPVSYDSSEFSRDRHSICAVDLGSNPSSTRSNTPSHTAQQPKLPVSEEPPKLTPVTPLTDQQILPSSNSMPPPLVPYTSSFVQKQITPLSQTLSAPLTQHSAETDHQSHYSTLSLIPQQVSPPSQHPVWSSRNWSPPEPHDLSNASSNVPRYRKIMNHQRWRQHDAHQQPQHLDAMSIKSLQQEHQELVNKTVRQPHPSQMPSYAQHLQENSTPHPEQPSPAMNLYLHSANNKNNISTLNNQDYLEPIHSSPFYYPHPYSSLPPFHNLHGMYMSPVPKPHYMVPHYPQYYQAIPPSPSLASTYNSTKYPVLNSLLDRQKTVPCSTVTSEDMVDTCEPTPSVPKVAFPGRATELVDMRNIPGNERLWEQFERTRQLGGPLEIPPPVWAPTQEQSHVQYQGFIAQSPAQVTNNSPNIPQDPKHCDNISAYDDGVDTAASNNNNTNNNVDNSLLNTTVPTQTHHTVALESDNNMSPHFTTSQQQQQRQLVHQERDKTAADMAVTNELNDDAMYLDDQFINTMISPSKKIICHNELNGCFEGFATETEVKAHEKQCILRCVQCFIDPCRWIGLLSKLSQHLRTSHGQKVVTDDEAAHVVVLTELRNKSVIRFVQSAHLRLFIIEVHFRGQIIHAACQWIPETHTIGNAFNDAPFGTLEVVSVVDTKCHTWQGFLPQYPTSFNVPRGMVAKSLLPCLSLPLPWAYHSHINNIVFHVGLHMVTKPGVQPPLLSPESPYSHPETPVPTLNTLAPYNNSYDNSSIPKERDQEQLTEDACYSEGETNDDDDGDDDDEYNTNKTSEPIPLKWHT